MNASVFSGTTAECLRHYGLSHRTAERRSSLTTFVEVSANTVVRWFNLRCLPKGENLLRIRYFLEAAGYEVQELVSLNRVVRDFGRLVAFRLVDLEVANEQLQFDRFDGFQSVYRVLFGRSQTTAGRLATMAELVREKSAMLDHARQTLLESAGAGVVVDSRKLASEQTCSSAKKEALFETLPCLAQALLPLAEAAASSALSRNDRERLRSLSGDGTIFRLSRALNRLCSETAQREFMPTASQEMAMGGAR